MWRFGLFCGLVAGGLMLALVGGAHAGDKDTSKAGTVRAAKTDDEPEVAEISEEKFACNADVVTVETAKGRVEVGKNAESALLSIRNRKVLWWCGSSDEDWAAPAGTEFIVVSRGPRGAGMVVYYKRK